MGIKTEDFASVPPKTMTAGIDWLGIFDPEVDQERKTALYVLGRQH